MSGHSAKRAREASPAKGAPATLAELLQKRLDDLVPTRATTSSFLHHLAQPSRFYPMMDPVLIDASGVPSHYLPNEFTRRTAGGEVRLVFGRRLLSPETTAQVHAATKTSAIAGTGYYLDKDGMALVIQRSSTEADGISFEHKKVRFTLGDDQHAQLLTYVSNLATGTTPSATKLFFVVASLRDVHRTKSSAKVLAALSVPAGTSPTAHLASLLSSTERHVPTLASNLLACLMTEGLLTSLLEAAEAGKVELQLLYNIVSGADLSLPIRNFAKGQGYDSAGRMLEAVKLSEVADEEEVITSNKVVTFNNFKSLSSSSLVFVKPPEGVFRKGPRKDKRDTYVEMSSLQSMTASDLLQYARAIQGASGLKAIEPAEKLEQKMDDLEDGEL